MFTAALFNANTIKSGHLQCYSAINFETYAIPPVQTQVRTLHMWEVWGGVVRCEGPLGTDTGESSGINLFPA